MHQSLVFFTFFIVWSPLQAFRQNFGVRKPHVVASRMVTESIEPIFAMHQYLHGEGLQSWMEYAAQGMADASTSSETCPAFGQPGWGLFCFLRGNPVFNAFDQFQAFIQTSVVSLHDVLQNAGVKNAYGPSIVLFTCLIRVILLPLLFQQLQSTEKTRALSPKIAEIKEKFPNDQNLQNQMTALLYQESKVNPLAGCLPAIVQIPVFIALYRSFQNLAMTEALREPFLYLPDLEGPVYGARSTSWLLGVWENGVPPLGWEATLAFLSVPVLLTAAQTLSIRLLSPPSDDPALQRTQRIIGYIPLLLGYFSLSFPAGLGVYYLTNSCLATVSTLGIKEYFKNNKKSFDIDIDQLANDRFSAFRNPAWGYTSQDQILEEARLNLKPSRVPRIPVDFA